MSNHDLDLDLDDVPATKGQGTDLRATRRRWAVHAIAWGLLAAVFLLVVGRFEAIFRDFGIATTAATAVLFRVSGLGPALIAITAALLAADWLILNETSVRTDPRRARAWNLAMILVPTAILGLTIAALATTLLDLLTRLTG